MSQHPGSPGRWVGWVALLDRREPGTSLALFRIACGLVVFGAVGSVAAHGLVPALWFVYGWCLGIQTYLTFPH